MYCSNTMVCHFFKPTIKFPYHPWICIGTHFYIKHLDVGGAKDSLNTITICNCQKENSFNFGYVKVLYPVKIYVHSKFSNFLRGETCRPHQFLELEADLFYQLHILPPIGYVLYHHWFTKFLCPINILTHGLHPSMFGPKVDDELLEPLNFLYWKFEWSRLTLH